jgi:predicted nicotinamide N-methyase
MNQPLSIQEYIFNDITVRIYVPDTELLKKKYTPATQKSKDFPFWAQVWPAAKALCSFLSEEPYWIINKTVLELAAGLGLPSLLSAQIAKHVICSDAAEDAVEFIKKSINATVHKNISARQINWHQLPADLDAEVVLMSDINYNPDEFIQLEKTIHQFLQQQSTVIISTPQRLMAKPFIEKILPFCIHQTEIEIKEPANTTACTIFVLKNPSNKINKFTV